jgi:hypothetical protein
VSTSFPNVGVSLRSTRTLLGLSGALLAASVVCCAKTASPPPHEIILAIDTDLVPGVDFDALQIEITTPTDRYKSTLKEFGQRLQPVHFPSTLAILGNADPSTIVHIRVAAGIAAGAGGTAVGSPIILRELATTIPAEGVHLLRVRLEWLCIGSAKPEPDGYIEGTCPEGSTCVAGDCVDWAIDSSKLPAYDERAVFGGGGPKGNGACFDTLPCFEKASAAAVDLATCTIAKPTGGAGVNVAIVTAPGQGGLCARGTCLVPLDAASPIGFVESSPGTLQLPKALCKKLAAGIASGVAVTTSCAAKTIDVPTCGPWSAITTNPGTLDAGLPDALAPSDAARDVADAD